MLTCFYCFFNKKKFALKFIYSFNLFRNKKKKLAHTYYIKNKFTKRKNFIFRETHKETKESQLNKKKKRVANTKSAAPRLTLDSFINMNDNHRLIKDVSNAL